MPVLGLQLQPAGSSERGQPGSQIWVVPTSGGQVQAPFKQTGAIAVVVQP